MDVYPLVQDTELIYWTKYTSLYSQYMFRNQNKLRSSLYSTIDKNGKIRVQFNKRNPVPVRTARSRKYRVRT